MLGRLNHTNLLRFAGLYTWALVGLPIIMNIWFLPPSRGVDGSGVDVSMTALSYFGFGVCYWLATRSLGGGRREVVRHVILLLSMSATAVGVGFYTQTGLSAVLLVIMAGVLPWLASIQMSVLWLAVAHAALVYSFMVRNDFSFWEGLLQALFYAGFSAFVLTTGYVAKKQAQAREEQRRLNAELRATRALLADSARVNERTRISRELHDLLGHHLTALSLNLEVAGHLSEGRVREHVQQAHTLARLLLTDVREAVSQLREGGAIDLGAALRPLAENVPKLAIEMDIEQPLTVDDPERAHVLLRCAQEAITNVVRHAGASRLWLAARREGHNIVLHVRDDGRGSDQVTPGNGLRGLGERLRQHGGRLDVDTRRGQGFQLTITLPVAPNAATRLPEGVIA